MPREHDPTENTESNDKNDLPDIDYLLKPEEPTEDSTDTDESVGEYPLCMPKLDLLLQYAEDSVSESISDGQLTNNQEQNTSTSQSKCQEEILFNYQVSNGSKENTFNSELTSNACSSKDQKEVQSVGLRGDFGLNPKPCFGGSDSNVDLVGKSVQDPALNSSDSITSASKASLISENVPDKLPLNGQAINQLKNAVNQSTNTKDPMASSMQATNIDKEPTPANTADSATINFNIPVLNDLSTGATNQDITTANKFNILKNKEEFNAPFPNTQQETPNPEAYTGGSGPNGLLGELLAEADAHTNEEISAASKVSIVAERVAEHLRQPACITQQAPKPGAICGRFNSNGFLLGEFWQYAVARKNESVTAAFKVSDISEILENNLQIQPCKNPLIPSLPSECEDSNQHDASGESSDSSGCSNETVKENPNYSSTDLNRSREDISDEETQDSSTSTLQLSSDISSILTLPQNDTNHPNMEGNSSAKDDTEVSNNKASTTLQESGGVMSNTQLQNNTKETQLPNSQHSVNVNHREFSKPSAAPTPPQSDCVPKTRYRRRL